MRSIVQKRSSQMGIFLIIFWLCMFSFSSLFKADGVVSPVLSASSMSIQIDKTASLVLNNNSDAVLWSTSNKGIVSLQQANTNKVKLCALKKGSAAVTACVTAGDGSQKKFVCKITVYDPVKLTGSRHSLTEGKKTSLKLSGTKQKVTWSSSNSKIAAVKKISSQQAEVTAKKAGSVSIRAVVGKHTYQFAMTVKEPEKPLKIAVAESSYSAAASTIYVLQALGAEVTLVDGSCSAKSYDGLVLPGGTDISPVRYHCSNQGSVGIDYGLDSLQFSVIAKFVKAKKPIFGICRGHQLINVYFGGTLKQNIPNHRGVWHNITITKGSWLYSVSGSRLNTLSYHHQAAGKLGKDLVVTARAKDGTVEALQHKTLPIYGTQWHPELMGSDGTKVIKAFLKVCRQYRAQAK